MATRNGSGRASASTATKNVPGNQTPNTPDVNESEIARLKVDQLRDRLRRRGITDMRKDELVNALITALREGRKTTGSGSGRTGSGRSAGSGSGRSAGSDSGRSAGSDSGRTGSGRSATGGRATTPDRSGARRPRSESTTTARPNARVPQPRAGGDDDAGIATGGQPVRTHAGQTGSGPALSMESADRVLTSMVPAEVEPVDEVVTPEGTVLTAEEGTAVATPPLPGTDARDRASSPAS